MRLNYLQEGDNMTKTLVALVLGYLLIGHFLADTVLSDATRNDNYFWVLIFWFPILLLVLVSAIFLVVLSPVFKVIANRR